jgi:nucleoside-diphosphate-sugar epimerase
MKIAVFGNSGFVGSNFIKNSIKYEFVIFSRNDIKYSNYYLSEDIYAVLNFVGKAHDLNDSSNYNDYYEINTKFCNDLFDKFLKSKSKVFITISSVKAVADELDQILTEEFIPNPSSHYGLSKLSADNYIMSRKVPVGKRFYILRPCMIHGPGNKGNLNLLFRFLNTGIPWPLGSYENKRSVCCIDNLIFVINQLINNAKIPSGIYNIADDDPLSTNDLINLIASSNNKSIIILKIPVYIIKFFSRIGDIIHLPLNSHRLKKLTQNYVVSNKKIKNAMHKSFPLSSHEGLVKTFNSFKN